MEWNGVRCCCRIYIEHTHKRVEERKSGTRESWERKNSRFGSWVKWKESTGPLWTVQVRNRAEPNRANKQFSRHLLVNRHTHTQRITRTIPDSVFGSRFSSPTPPSFECPDSWRSGLIFLCVGLQGFNWKSADFVPGEIISKPSFPGEKVSVSAKSLRPFFLIFLATYLPGFLLSV